MPDNNTPSRAFAFLAVAIFVVLMYGCSKNAPLTRDLLVGTWQNTVDGKTNVISYHSDGTFGGKWETGSWGILSPTIVIMSGNWTLDGNTVKYTVTKSSYNNEALSGQIMTDTIMSINDTTVVFRDETAGGEISTWIRRR